MKSARCWQIDPPAKGLAIACLFSLAFWVALIGLLLWLCSCSTVAPTPTQDSTPSFDGTNQNSGFVGWGPAGQGILSATGKARYDALVGLYGARFVPRVNAGDGITPLPDGLYLIDQEHLVKFIRMNQWRKDGR